MNKTMVLNTPMVSPPIQIVRGLILSFKKLPISGAAPRAMAQANQYTLI